MPLCSMVTLQQWISTMEKHHFDGSIHWKIHNDFDGFPLEKNLYIPELKPIRPG
jgi:hypothetical protein